jgi:hypothetical protein
VAGKAYTLNLTLGMKEVKVDATVGGWDTTPSPATPDLP